MSIVVERLTLDDCIHRRQRQIRHKSDTRVAIAVTLQRNGIAVDLTSLTVRFMMVLAQDGTVKVAETSDNVSETDAANGECQYNPQAADVDTAGTYYAYFTVEDGSNNRETFPTVTGGLEIAIMPGS